MSVVRSAIVSVAFAVLLAGPCAGPAAAQYGASNPATGEKYNIELAVGWWMPEVAAVLASESLGIIGTEIDLVNDLGFVDEDFLEFRAVLRPARKHKFRISYTPIKYEADATLRRDLVFNGIVFPIRFPVTTALDWKAWRFGYEYDFIYRDRGFLGVVLEAKYTDVTASLTNPISTEFTSVKAPIPAVGVIGRVYPAANIALTGEFTGFNLPGDLADLDEDDTGSYFDFDVYATLNFTNNVGVTGGWRRLAVEYRIDEDFGDFELKGFYLQGVVRF
jgi:hypothetical protein